MFSIEYRNQIHDRILQMARADNRITAGAVVGSLAIREGDRWADLDLTFGVADEYLTTTVLEEWSLEITKEFHAVHLFDLPSGASIYRVFLLPGCLQFDLSFTPASKFGATGPKFKLLFGSSIEKPFNEPPSENELIGYAVHHLVRGRFCIERGRLWHAEYWLHSARDTVLALACRRRGLAASHGRGFDDLPASALDYLNQSLVSSLEREELLHALRGVVDFLLAEANGIDMAKLVEHQLHELAGSWEE
jgi:hypothetical protein